MGDCINYLDTPMKFIKEYSFKDKKEIYTNGTELVPLFRVEQMLGHYMPSWIPISERLPVGEEMVLVSCMTKKGVSSVNRAYFSGVSWHGSGSMSGVIAWMPLPEPYKPSVI